MLRNHLLVNRLRAQDGGYLFRSVSEDSGRSWSSPTATAISGSPAQMIRTASGQILCVYRHVGYPEGYRGVLSDDELSKPSPVANARRFAKHPNVRRTFGPSIPKFAERWVCSSTT